MAVELRCPKCKAKLKLRDDPEPDAEIECPKCEHAFPCEENIIHAGAADDEKPTKKKADDEAGEKPTKKTDKKTDEKDGKKSEEKKPEGENKKPKKRKGKKRKTKPAILITIIVGAVVAIGSVTGVLIWFFTKKSASQEMMTYLPDECEIVCGLNLGHMQKYPEFYKSCKSSMGNTGFKKAGDAFAKALGSETIDDVVDYVVQGAGFAGGKVTGGRVDATVMRTKVEYDTSLLSKIPGAKKYTLNSVDYFTLPDIPELGYPGLRVFAPTSRLVVFCSGATLTESKFKAVLSGNKDNLDATPYVRAGALGKQVIRGTVWQFHLTERPSPSMTNYVRPPPTGDEEKELWKEIGQVFSGAKASGYKASVGSRETRGEWFVWYRDSESASSMLKKWKEKEWIKDDEKDPPRWFKSMADRSGIGKTAVNVLRDGLAFKSSGEVFSIRMSAETKLMQQSLSSIVNSFIGQSQSAMGGPGGMPGTGGGPGGVPGPGGMPGPGGVPAKP